MTTATLPRAAAVAAGPLRRDLVPAILWLHVLADTFDAVRPTFWADESEAAPAIMRP